MAEEDRVVGVVAQHKWRLWFLEERRVPDAAATGRQLTREEAQPAALALQADPLPPPHLVQLEG